MATNASPGRLVGGEVALPSPLLDRYGSNSITAFEKAIEEVDCNSAIVFHLKRADITQFLEVCPYEGHRKFSYDYATEVARYEAMGQSIIHAGMCRDVKDAILTAVRTVHTPLNLSSPTFRGRLASCDKFGDATIHIPKVSVNMPDLAIGEPGEDIQPFLGEIATSQTTAQVEAKAIKWITEGKGYIRAVLVIEVNYPSLKESTVSLLVWDGAQGQGRWEVRRQNFSSSRPNHDNRALGFYVSDFFAPEGLPAEFCRPSAAEQAAGLSRLPQVIITFAQLQEIFLRRRAQQWTATAKSAARAAAAKEE